MTEPVNLVDQYAADYVATLDENNEQTEASVKLAEAAKEKLDQEQLLELATRIEGLMKAEETTSEEAPAEA